MSSRVRAAAVHTTVASPAPYIAYGLTLLSHVPLPELRRAPEVDMDEACVIRFSRRRECFTDPSHEVMAWTLPTGERWLSCTKFAGGYVLQFPHLATFYVDDLGRDITYHPTSNLSPETLSHLLLDQVLPLVLNVRGEDALHATAVLTPYGVCAFTGPTGMGKSTLAASFHNAGFPVLSDDCLVLRAHQGHLLATPAYPGFRLWGDALSTLGIVCGSTRPVAHYTTKQRVMTSDRIDHLPETSCHVVGIYSLIRQPVIDNDGLLPPVQSERLSRRDALMELLPHTFRMDLTDHHMLIRQLDFLEQVVTHVPIHRLQFPSSFDALDQLRETILTNLG